VPEDTHSIEAGYQYKKDDTSYLATFYYRQTYHAFTTVTRYIDSSTLLTTQENLATNRSGGSNWRRRPTSAAGHGEFQLESFLQSNRREQPRYSAAKSALAWNAKLTRAGTRPRPTWSSSTRITPRSA